MTKHDRISTTRPQTDHNITHKSANRSHQRRQQDHTLQHHLTSHRMTSRSHTAVPPGITSYSHLAIHHRTTRSSATIPHDHVLQSHQTTHHCPVSPHISQSYCAPPPPPPRPATNDATTLPQFLVTLVPHLANSHTKPCSGLTTKLLNWFLEQAPPTRSFCCTT